MAEWTEMTLLRRRRRRILQRSNLLSGWWSELQCSWNVGFKWIMDQDTETIRKSLSTHLCNWFNIGSTMGHLEIIKGTFLIVIFLKLAW